MSLPLTKQALLAEISQSRAVLTRDFRAFKDGMNVAEKLRVSVRAYAPFWLGGAAIAGFFVTRLLGKVKTGSLPKRGISGISKFFPKSLKPFKYGGALLTVFRYALPLLKPVLTAYNSKMAKLPK